MPYVELNIKSGWASDNRPKLQRCRGNTIQTSDLYMPDDLHRWRKFPDDDFHVGLCGGESPEPLLVRFLP